MQKLDALRFALAGGIYGAVAAIVGDTEDREIFAASGRTYRPPLDTAFFDDPSEQV